MSKSATIKSGIPVGKKAGQAMAKSRMSTNSKVLIGACAVVLVIGGLIIAAMPDPGAAKPAQPRATAGAGQAAGSPDSGSPAGALRARETVFNFGSISMAAGKVTHRYRFTNAGTTPIVLGKMYTSCMCTTAALVKSSGRKFEPVGMPGHSPIPSLNETMQPNEEVMVEVVFDPAAHGPAGIGPIDRVVTIEHNAGQPLELVLTANVKP